MLKNTELSDSPPPVSVSSQSRTPVAGSDLEPLALSFISLCSGIRANFHVDPIFALTEIQSINRLIYQAVTRSRLDTHV